MLDIFSVPQISYLANGSWEFKRLGISALADGISQVYKLLGKFYNFSFSSFCSRSPRDSNPGPTERQAIAMLCC